VTLPILEISRSGMDVEYQRLQVVAQNIANLGSARSADGETWFPLRLISGPRGAAASPLTPAAAAVKSSLQPPGAGVQVLGVERISTPPRRVYEPSHPQADSRGFVHFPGIDQLSEMTTLMKAVRVYEANVAVFGASRSMALKALDIGGRG
jgi:flagellar basal-body rod protein FlgC